MLASETESRSTVVSTSTLSHYYRQVIDTALPPSSASNYMIHSVLPKASDASAWWRTRSGVGRVMNHGLRLAFVICSGESVVDPNDPYPHLVAEPTTP